MSYAFTSLPTLPGLGAASSAAAVSFVRPDKWKWDGAGYVYGKSQIPFGEDFAAIAADLRGTPTAVLEQALSASIDVIVAPFATQVADLRAKLGGAGASPFVNMGRTITETLLSGDDVSPERVTSVLSQLDSAVIGGRGAAAFSRLTGSDLGSRVTSAIGTGTAAAGIAASFVSIGQMLATGELSLGDAGAIVASTLGTVGSAAALLAGSSAALMAGPQAAIGIVTMVFSALMGLLESLFGPPAYVAAAREAAEDMAGFFKDDAGMRKLQRLEMQAWRSWIHAFDTIARLVREDMAADNSLADAGPRVLSLSMDGARRGTVLEKAFRTTLRIHEAGGWLLAAKDASAVTPAMQLVEPGAGWKVWRLGPGCGQSTMYDWILDPPERINANTAAYTRGLPSDKTSDGYDDDNERGHWCAARQLELLRSTNREPAGKMLRLISEVYADERAARRFYGPVGGFGHGSGSNWQNPTCTPWPASREGAHPVYWRNEELDDVTYGPHWQCGVYRGAWVRGGVLEAPAIPMSPSFARRSPGDQAVMLRCALHRVGQRPTQGQPHLQVVTCDQAYFTRIWTELAPAIPGVTEQAIREAWTDDAALCARTLGAAGGGGRSQPVYFDNFAQRYEGIESGKPPQSATLSPYDPATMTMIRRVEFGAMADRAAWSDLWDLEQVRTWFRFPGGFLDAESRRDPVIRRTLELMADLMPPDVERLWDTDATSMSWSRAYERRGWQARTESERANAFNQAKSQILDWQERFASRSLELILTLTSTVQNKLQAQIAAKTLALRQEREQKLGAQGYGYWGTEARFNEPKPLGGKTGPEKLAQELGRMPAADWLSADSVWAYAGLMRALLNPEKREKAVASLRTLAFDAEAAAPVYRTAALVLLQVDGAEPGDLTALPRRTPDRGDFMTAAGKRVGTLTHLGALAGAWRQLEAEVDEMTPAAASKTLGDVERILFAAGSPREQRLRALLVLHEHGQPKILSAAEDLLPDVLADETTAAWASAMADRMAGAVDAAAKQQGLDAGEEPETGGGSVLPWIAGAAVVGGLAWWWTTQKR